eukprot:767075-Hanusia_phi.AAC.3
MHFRLSCHAYFHLQTLLGPSFPYRLDDRALEQRVLYPDFTLSDMVSLAAPAWCRYSINRFAGDHQQQRQPANKEMKIFSRGLSTAAIAYRIPMSSTFLPGDFGKFQMNGVGMLRPLFTTHDRSMLRCILRHDLPMHMHSAFAQSSKNTIGTCMGAYLVLALAHESTPYQLSFSQSLHQHPRSNLSSFPAPSASCLSLLFLIVAALRTSGLLPCPPLKAHSDFLPPAHTYDPPFISQGVPP